MRRDWSDNMDGPQKPKQNRGEAFLVPRSAWVPPQELLGEREVLEHPIMERAFMAILQRHKPRSHVALFGLCTYARPYSRSLRWRRLKKLFERRADLTITSNGGVIPLRFERCYPFLTYNAHGGKDTDELYVQTLERRLHAFLDAFPRYTHVMAAYRPKLRNTPVMERVIEARRQDGRLVDGCVLVPDYTEITVGMRESTGTKMHPEVHPVMLERYHQQLLAWGA
jgi:hypothetical protein